MIKHFTKSLISERGEGRPAPPFRQCWQASGIRRGGLLVLRFPIPGRCFALLFEFAELILLPAAAAFHEDALQQFAGGFGVRVFFAPVRGERAFHRSLENRGSIELQLVPYPLQSRNARIEVGEQFVEGISDAVLLGLGWNGNGEFPDNFSRYGFEGCSGSLGIQIIGKATEGMQQVFQGQPRFRPDGCKATPDATLNRCKVCRPDRRTNGQENIVGIRDLVWPNAPHPYARIDCTEVSLSLQKG